MTVQHRADPLHAVERYRLLWEHCLNGLTGFKINLAETEDILDADELQDHHEHLESKLV